MKRLKQLNCILWFDGKKNRSKRKHRETIDSRTALLWFDEKKNFRRTQVNFRCVNRFPVRAICCRNYFVKWRESQMVFKAKLKETESATEFRQIYTAWLWNCHRKTESLWQCWWRLASVGSKGQLISKTDIKVFIWTKNDPKNLKDFCPESFYST